MSEGWSGGECGVCGNRLFIQYTLVLLAEGSNFTDASGRAKRLADDVRKAYECMKCRARYLHDETAGVWVKG